MQEYATTHCPNCGQRVEVPMRLMDVSASPTQVSARAAGSVEHTCPTTTVEVDGR